MELAFYHTDTRWLVTVVVCLVADFGAIIFQVTMNFMRATSFEFTTNSAIKYNTCYGLIIIVFFNIEVLF